MFGMLRTTWSCPRIPVSAAVVAPARTLRTSWPRRRCGPISRPTLFSIWGLMPSRITSASRTASRLSADGPDAVLALQGLATLGSRVARDDAARLDERAAQQAGDHGLGHDARADRGDRRVREGGHRPEYSDAVAGLPERLAGRGVTGSGGAGRYHQEEPARRRDLDLLEARRAERGDQLVGRVEHLDDRELAAVGQPAQRRGRRRARDGRPRSDAGSGSESMEARRPSGLSQRRARARKSPSRSRGTWLSQKPRNSPSTARSGSAHASRTCRWARRLCATRRSRARSSAAGEASYRDSSPRDASNGDHQPVPAASSTISPAHGSASSHRPALSSSACQAASWIAPRAYRPRRRYQSSYSGARAS